MRLIHRIQYLLRQRRHERELAEEIESHRQMVEDQQRAAGLPEQDARHAAHRAMGSATLAREDARGVWIATWVQSVFQDLGYAARSLKSQPGFTALALLALALGTGVNTSLFTLLKSGTPPSWPVRDPGSVVMVSGNFSVAEYRYISAHAHALAGLALVSFRFLDTILDGKDDEPIVETQFVGGNYFSLLGVDMALGRGFSTPKDRMEAPEAVAILSHKTWQTRYGGDPGILGRRIRINDAPFTVIGVVNQKFSQGPDYPDPGLWVPYPSHPLVLERGQIADTDPWCDLVARLAPGVSREQARAELSTLSRQFHSDAGTPPRNIKLHGVTRLDFWRIYFDLGSNVLFAAPVSILLLACANVSNLLLARSAARQREIAVRICIGAGRARIVRQLLTESLLLSAIGSALGLLLAYVVSALLAAWLSADRQLPDLAPDLTVLGYAIAIAVFSAALFGLAPALSATRTGVSEAMKQRGAHASPRFPLRGVLLGVQVAISVTLLLAAGLLTRGQWVARSLDRGYKTNGVTTLRIYLPGKRSDDPRRRVLLDTIVQQMRPFGPIGIGSPPPAGGSWLPVTLTGEKTATVTLRFLHANAGYFDVLGIPIVAGRNFVPADGKLRNILINEAMARRYWPGQTCIGQSIFHGDERREIVGVVRDAQLAGPGPIEPTFFEHSDTVELLMPDALSTIAAAVARRVEPRAQVISIRLSDLLERFLLWPRVIALVAISLGALALFLATGGVYGVISYSVEHRRREIGIRMALGAQPREILGLVLRSNARAVVIGLAVGLAVFLAGSKVLESLLYGVSRLDPLAHGAVAAVLLAAAAAACVIPARRATRIAPVEALRQE